MGNPKGIPVSHGAYINGHETSTHAIWRGMISRCENNRCKSYPYYGARGVRVCARWHKYENFLVDMGERPNGLQLDRWPDASGHYAPSNCRWATASQQQNNTRRTRFFRYNGKILPASSFASELGISRALFSYHNKRGHYDHARV